ncbi:MAG: IS1182 family transposase [Ignavibacteriae bacterium]|nr:IS1182 family transposase [Ignavibacteriota bacterium]
MSKIKHQINQRFIDSNHRNGRETPYITGSDRNQTVMFPPLVDDYVSNDNPVRFIEEYVKLLDLTELGFTHSVPKLTGRPSYSPSDLLKLYIYGYLKKTRSSRQLAQLTHLNVEVFWLLKKLHPDFRTISDFRKDNVSGLKKVCQEFTIKCKKFNLFGGELVAIDGSKFNAVNHNSKVISAKNITKLIKEIDENIEDYFQNLERQDLTEESIEETTAEDLKAAISKLKKDRENLSRLQTTLKESGETQIAQTDPDCKKMRTGHQGIDMCYNVQIAVDSKHKLIVAHDVTNDTNDLNQLVPLAEQAKEMLEVETLNVTADKGYFNEEQIAECESNNIKCYIPTPDNSKNKSKGLFTYKDFTYDKKNDLYDCPGKEKLTRTIEVTKHDKPTVIYKTKACKTCNLKSKCTTSKEGRRIYRNIHKGLIEPMQERMKENPSIGNQRKSIVEHPFGTLKHTMGHGHFLMRGKENVAAEMSMSVLTYNMKRIMNLFGIPTLLAIINYL